MRLPITSCLKTQKAVGGAYNAGQCFHATQTAETFFREAKAKRTALYGTNEK